MKITIFLCLGCICYQSFAASAFKLPPSEYHMTASFRCETVFAGGVNHEKYTHNATQFSNAKDDFRLVHRTAMPKTILELWDQVDQYPEKLNNPLSREMGIVLEENTYFLRKVKNNPSLDDSWTACYLNKFSGSRYRIQCEVPSSTFRLSLDTKKFVHMYLGTWDDPAPEEMPGYTGDSSVFRYGYCSAYYD